MLNILKKKKSFIAIFMIAALIVCSFAGYALALELKGEASVTVVFPDSSFEADEDRPAALTVDLYKVADAEGMSGYDTYELTTVADIFEGAVKDFDLNSPDNDAKGWTELAKACADAALTGSSVPESAGSGDTDKAITVEPGLYLIITRAKDVNDPAEYYDSENHVSIANTPTYTYKFAPQLLALPYRGETAVIPSGEDADGSFNTADSGEWQYDVTLTLKPEQERRKGGIEIVKTLESYENSEVATFVFQVEAELNDEIVLSNVYSINFNAPGTRSLTIDDIPVGAEVTVTEVYSGSSYTLVSQSAPENPVITADDHLNFSFTNDYDGSRRHGHGIVNTFENKDGTWDWEKYDPSADSSEQ